MKNVYFVILFSLLYCCPLHALTLEEAIQKTMENNRLYMNYKRSSRMQDERTHSQWRSFMSAFHFKKPGDEDDPRAVFKDSVFGTNLSFNLSGGITDMYEHEAEKSLSDASLFKKKAVEADIKLDVQRAYIETLRAKKNLEVTQQAVESLEFLLDNANKVQDQHRVNQDEIGKIQNELASARQRRLAAEALMNKAREGLGTVMLESGDSDEPIEDLCPVNPKKFKYHKLAAMLKSRSEIRFLEALKAAKKQKTKALKENQPASVDLGFSVDEYEDYTVAGEKEEKLDTEAKLMLAAKLNVFDNFRRQHDVALERADIKDINERKEETEKLLSFQLERIYDKYQVSVQELHKTEESLQKAEEVYQKAHDGFRRNQLTAHKLLSSFVSLTEARLEHNNARFDMLSSMAELERVVEKPIGIPLECDEK